MAVHVSHAALPYPVKGARYSILVPYLDADGDPTAPATPDTEISKDNAAAADCAEEVSATSGMDGMGLLTLSGAETDASTVALNAKVASGPKATLATIYPRVLPVAFSGTASAGANGSITLATDIPAIADLLIGCIVKTTGGTGGGGTGGANNQARVITAFNTSRVASVVPNWETNPASDTTYEILLTEFAFLRLADLVAYQRVKADATNPLTATLPSTERVKLAASQPDYAPAVAGAAMTLTSGERSTLAAVIEAALFNEADATALLAALAAKVEAFILDDGDGAAVLAGIGTAVRTALATELARIDTTIGSRSSHTAAQVRAEMDSNSTKLASIDAKTTNLPAIPAAQGKLDTVEGLASGASGFAAIKTDAAAVKVVTDKVNGMLQLDGAGPAYQFTTAAVENAPGGGGSIEDVTVSAFEDAALQQLAGVAVNLQQPVRGPRQALELIQGDDYFDADGRSIPFTISGLTQTAADFVVADTKLNFKQGENAASFDCVDISDSGSDVVFTFEASASETAAMTVSDNWRYNLKAKLASGKFLTPIYKAKAQVFADYEAAA